MSRTWASSGELASGLPSAWVTRATRRLLETSHAPRAFSRSATTSGRVSKVNPASGAFAASSAMLIERRMP